ncbi:MAG: ABC transporter permease [Bacillota bacterium]
MVEGIAENTNIIDIALIQLALAYVFLIILVIIAKKQKIGREKQILLAATRMTVQLVLVGFVLDYIFDYPHPLITLLILVIMEGFAIQNIYARVSVEPSTAMKKVIAFSMFAGTVSSIIFFILVVVGLRPWFYPRYFIPIAGMLIGNSMTGISLGAEHLISQIKGNPEKIEQALMIGAKPELAIKDIVNQAFYNAVLPTINSMIGMGIIFLPGMMTGQILSGVSPLVAIRYQIAIMLGILGSVTLTVFILIKLGGKTFFNSRLQLKSDE